LKNNEKEKNTKSEYTKIIDKTSDAIKSDITTVAAKVSLLLGFAGILESDSSGIFWPYYFHTNKVLKNIIGHVAHREQAKLQRTN